MGFSYYWILDKLDLYKPQVWEFSRLNISQHVLSKRKLNKLLEKNIITDWDDPRYSLLYELMERLLTLSGLRRRGFNASILKAFCEAINVTRRGNEMMISYKLLEKCARKILF